MINMRIRWCMRFSLPAAAEIRRPGQNRIPIPDWFYRAGFIFLKNKCTTIPI
jgi:hypothetical protein